jgi:hypothetical protein
MTGGFIFRAFLLLVILSHFFHRVGYSGISSIALATAACVPVINLALFFYLSSVEWPIETEARTLRMEVGRGSLKDARFYLRQGARLEEKGLVLEAQSSYLDVLARFSHHEPARKEAQAALGAVNEWIANNVKAGQSS